MSRVFSESFPCPWCDAPQEMGIVVSVNADRRPDPPAADGRAEAISEVPDQPEVVAAANASARRSPVSRWLSSAGVA